MPPFWMLLIELESAHRGKAHCGFAGFISTTLGATQVTKRAHAKTSHIIYLLGNERSGAPIWLPVNSSSQNT